MIYTDPVTDGKNVFEYRIGDGEKNAYVYDDETQQNTEKIILETPVLIEYLSKSSPGYHFMKFYYRILTQFNFNMERIPLFPNREIYNPRCIELFKKFLPKIINNEYFKKNIFAIGEIYLSRNEEITRYFRDYAFENKCKKVLFENIMEYSKNCFDESEKYFSNPWFLKSGSKRFKLVINEDERYCKLILQTFDDKIISRFIKTFIRNGNDDLDFLFAVIEKFEHDMIYEIFVKIAKSIEEYYVNSNNKILLKLEDPEFNVQNFIASNRKISTCENFKREMFSFFGSHFSEFSYFVRLYLEFKDYKLFTFYDKNGCFDPEICPNDDRSFLITLISNFSKIEIKDDPEIFWENYYIQEQKRISFREYINKIVSCAQEKVFEKNRNASPKSEIVLEEFLNIVPLFSKFADNKYFNEFVKDVETNLKYEIVDEKIKYKNPPYSTYGKEINIEFKNSIADYFRI